MNLTRGCVVVWVGGAMMATATLAEKQYNVKLTKDPDARATMGRSSGGSAAPGSFTAV